MKFIFDIFRPGQKYMRIRKLLEQEIWSVMGIRNNIKDYYQYPRSSNQATCYLQLYARNIERNLETVAFGYGQLSVRSLWPIILKQKTSSTSKYKLLFRILIQTLVYRRTYFKY